MQLLGGLWPLRANYRVVPWATFTNPEVARVGLSEQEAQQRNIGYELTRYELDHHDRALADGEAHGFVKVLTVPGADRILGVSIVGYHAGELIGEFVFAMTHGLGLKKISAVTHIYPLGLNPINSLPMPGGVLACRTSTSPISSVFFAGKEGDRI